MFARARCLLVAGAWVVVPSLCAQDATSRVLSGQQVVRRVDSLWSAAVARGTRKEDGTPGARYWTQSARYELHATLDAQIGTLRGSGLLRYRNRSPDTLSVIALALAQNLFRAGAPHSEPVPVTGGITIQTLCVARLSRAATTELCDSALNSSLQNVRIDNTIAWLTLPSPLFPGDSVDVRAQWEFVIPGIGAPRMGTDGSVAMIGYWYPQFVVYDDVVGWAADPYLATGEFYMDHAEYDVRITVPGGYLVGATGMLQNAHEVLSPAVRERLQRAATSFAAVAVVSDSLRRAGGATLPNKQQTWHFTAPVSRDFAFYTSRDVVWDAMAALVPNARGTRDTVLIHALYRPREREWKRAADYGRQSVEHFSARLWPYPWKQMTLVEGIVNGGMEFPMLTVVSDGGGSRSLMTTIAHEIGHMWFPMQVGSDERRFAWMDEGMASWMERSLSRTISGRDDEDDGIPDLYRTVANIQLEQSMLTHADHYRNAMTYTAASYDKLVVVLRAFVAEYGDSALTSGLRAYGAAWSGKHPYPPDFVRVVFAAAGAERESFVQEWVRGTGTYDAQIADVERAADTLTVTITIRGGAHLSVPVMIMRESGRAETIVIRASQFRANPVQTLRIGGARSVTSIVLDPMRTRPDLDVNNQRWAP